MSAKYYTTIIMFLTAANAFGSVITEPVNLSGSGTFSWTKDSGTEVNLWATSGAPVDANYVAFQIDTAWNLAFNVSPGSTEPGIGGMTNSYGWATIGDVSSKYFNVVLSPGPDLLGSLTLYDANRAVLASVLVDAHENITSEIDNGYGGVLTFARQGTLSVTANPEPGTWILIMPALCVGWIGTMFRKSKDRKSQAIRLPGMPSIFGGEMERGVAD